MPPPNTPAGSYNISVQSTIPNSGTPNVWYSTPRNFAVQIGPFSPSQITVTGEIGVCNGNLYNYSVNVPGGHRAGYTYSWTYPSGWIVENITANTIRFYIPLYNSSYGPVRVSINNSCGSTITGVTVTPENCNYTTAGNFKIYPNLQTGNLIYIEENNNVPENALETENRSDAKIVEFKIELYDQQNILVHTSESELGIVTMTNKNL